LPPLDGGDWQGIGSAFDAPALSDKLTRRYADQIVGIEKAALPSAREIVVIAARELAIRGTEAALAPEFAAPLYLRNKVAMTMAERAAEKLKMATV
jgi:tRNA threonylcarbamoyladenosine biosynthesis protein TsaB